MIELGLGLGLGLKPMPVVVAAPTPAISREKRSIREREVALEHGCVSLRGMGGSQTDWSEERGAREPYTCP